MATKTASKTVVDVIDHYELLLLFRAYVNQCIEDFNFSNKIRPRSFDEWYEWEYKPNIDTLTQVVHVTLQWETACGGHLCGTDSAAYQMRIPAGILTESGGIVDSDEFKRVCAKFANKTNMRLPCVLYQGKRAYHWTWS